MSSDSVSGTRGLPVTKGILVSKRAGLVDTLENMLSGGQQEAILTATLAAAELSLGNRLIDVGCGTGKLAIAAARRVGAAGKVIGIDATPEMIHLALLRATEERSSAQFHLGVAESLPAETASMDAVTSSYFFHHLPSDVKHVAMHEMWRVLKPGGRLVITDYGRPRNLLGYIASFPMRFDFHEYVRPQLRGELEWIIDSEGFGTPKVKALFLGYIGVLQLIKPR
jgi:ubiquinone/menaquinone biosynthesis C-methylase UbiE